MHPLSAVLYRVYVVTRHASKTKGRNEVLCLVLDAEKNE